MLHLLWAEREVRELGGVEAAHLDHGLRGAEAEAEADWVADWCRERGIVCHIGRVDLSAKRGQSVQEAARAARYEFLALTAAAVGANLIATGHTRDDQAETVLGNILRGSGLDGLRGIPGRRQIGAGRGVMIVRPLLDVSRAEVETYNAAHGLSPRRDPSNLSAEHYTRNRLRLELLPQLRRDYNVRVDAALVRLSEIAGRDSDYLRMQAAAALEEATRARDTERLTLDRAALAALHPALLRYVVRLAVEQVRGTAEGMGFEPTEALCRAVTDGLDSTCTLPNPLCRVQTAGNLVTISAAAKDGGRADAWPPAFLAVPGEAALGEWTVRAAFENHADGVRLDADGVDLASLHVRAWQAGDKLDPLGMGGRHKKVSDIFADAKVPRSERHRIPIVADAQGILWVAGYAQSERAKEAPSTVRRLFLSLHQTNPAGNGGENME